MQCDLIIAADNAKFGQPEIKLGIIPGIGGTQRFTRAVGKAKAMDLILTGRIMEVQEAERAGLVARIVPLASLVEDALKIAEDDRVDVAAFGARRPRKRSTRVRDFAGRGRALRTPRVSFAVCDRRPEGRHGGLHRQAAAEVREQVIRRRVSSARTRRAQRRVRSAT